MRWRSAETGARPGRITGASTPAWLAHATKTTRQACFRDLHLAEALDGDFEATRRALAAGEIDVDKARIIINAVRDLTEEYDDLPAGVHAEAEAHLLEKAVEFDAPGLRMCGRRLFEVVCPGAADAAEGKKLPAPVLAGQGLMELLEKHLNLDSMPLDLGREQRLFGKGQKIALNHVYGGCAAANCDRPPAWVEYHHKKPWAKGGRTDLADGIPLCPPHHQMADHPETWTIHYQPDGTVRFHRRT